MKSSSNSDSDTSLERRYAPLFGTHVRFVVLVIVLFCLASIWSNIVAINFVMICMAPIENGTAEENADRHTITTEQYSWYLSIVAIAALSTNFIAVYLIDRYGIRTVFCFLGMLSAVATALLPMAIRNGFIAVMSVRFLQGVSFCVNYAIIGAFASKWATYKQVGLLVSVLVAFVQFSSVITMSISGPICTSSFGWPAVFYSHAAFSFVLFTIYGAFYRNSPNSHPLVGSIEKAQISVGKIVVDKSLPQRRPPYGAILRTPAVWGIFAGAVANFGVVNFMLAYYPIYLSRALGFTVNKTGFSAALPPLLQFIAKVSVGLISDKVTCLSDTNKLRFFNSVAMYLCGACYLALGFLGDEWPTLNMLILGGTAGFLGIDTGGFFKAGPLIAKQYSHIITGIFSFLCVAMMLIVPFLADLFLQGQVDDIGRWQNIFRGCAVCMVVSSTLFCIFVSAKPAEWTKEHTSKEELSRKQAGGARIHPEAAMKPVV